MTKPGRHFFQNIYRDAGKRIRTRALILDTAIELLAEKGIERTSVAEIAQRAGLSNGSFYYHFKDKDALLSAVGGTLAAIFVHEIDQAISEVDDGIERVAIATQLFVERAATTPHWGFLVVHALADLGEFRDQISRGIQQDVRIGIEQGLFSLPPVPAVFPMLLAIVGAAVSEHLLDPVENAHAGILASEIILKALGVDAGKASEVVNNVNAKLGAFALDPETDFQDVISDLSL